MSSNKNEELLLKSKLIKSNVSSLVPNSLSYYISENEPGIDTLANLNLPPVSKTHPTVTKNRWILSGGATAIAPTGFSPSFPDTSFRLPPGGTLTSSVYFTPPAGVSVWINAVNSMPNGFTGGSAGLAGPYLDMYLQSYGTREQTHTIISKTGASASLGVMRGVYLGSTGNTFGYLEFPISDNMNFGVQSGTVSNQTSQEVGSDYSGAAIGSVFYPSAGFSAVVQNINPTGTIDIYGCRFADNVINS